MGQSGVMVLDGWRMVERCWKDVKGYWKNVGRMLKDIWRMMEEWWWGWRMLKDIGRMLEGYWRIFEGCWKNGNEDDNENEVYEGLRWALLSGWLESEMIDFSWIRGFDDGRTDGRTDICDCRVAFATEKLEIFNLYGNIHLSTLVFE